jgi:hypothetical protein
MGGHQQASSIKGRGRGHDTASSLKEMRRVLQPLWFLPFVMRSENGRLHPQNQDSVQNGRANSRTWKITKK